MILAITLAILVTILSAGISIGLYLWWKAKNTPDYILASGMSIFFDEEVKKRLLAYHIGLYNSIFVEEMSKRVNWSVEDLYTHISKTTVTFSSNKLRTPLRSDPSAEYNGITYSATSFGIACDKELCWDEQGLIQLQKTAYGYELLNSCIYDIEEDGYMKAIAESELDVYNKDFWAWCSDKNSDGIVNEKDMELWKAERRKFDIAFNEVEPIINSALDKIKKTN